VGVPVTAHGGRAKASAAPAVPASPPIKADSTILVDMATGEPIYARNADVIRPIASITKLMVALVVLDHGLDMNGVTTITQADRDAARGGARSGLLLGRSFKNSDLITAMLMQSDNRAVTALGRAVGLDTTGLVAAMNAKAVSMGLTATAFTDPVGLSPGNVSTAREIADFLSAALKIPLVHQITTSSSAHITAADGSGYAVNLVNTDHIARDAGSGAWTLLGGKTGYTDLAHYCLAIGATIGGEDVAMVFLGEQGRLTRFADFVRAAQWLLAKSTAAGAPTQAQAQTTTPP
jgi:D-alanyl-D-alanine endopeptidase (penicillin-binding protein 7)